MQQCWNIYFKYRIICASNYKCLGKTIMCSKRDLNYDFNHLLFLAKKGLSSLSDEHDRMLATKWIYKLSFCDDDPDELKRRNEIMRYLVANLQENQLRAPFTEGPPRGPLPHLSHYLNKSLQIEENAEDWDCTQKCPGKEPLINQLSPDGGAFLASQPIPRSGAFCYLAVVSRGRK